MANTTPQQPVVGEETAAPPQQVAGDDAPTEQLEADPQVVQTNDEDDHDDADSAVDSGSIASSTDSLSESIFDYRRLHGRPYQKSQTTEYWAPVDDAQNEGLDILHHVLLMVLEDRLFLAPIGDNPGDVLDIGTGTGIWAIDFADQFPSAEVTGTDISPIQPSWVPPNCKFVIDDCVLEWTWPPERFDFVHMRAMYGCIPDWEDLYRKVYKHLKPGGWFEDVEMDVRIESDHAVIPEDHIFSAWAQLFYDGGDKLGRSFTIAQGHKMRELMEKVGFVDIYEEKFKIPLHGWPKDPRLRNAGLLAQAALDQSLDGFGTFLLTQVHGWERDQAIVYIASMRRETRKITWYPYYITQVISLGPEFPDCH